MEQEKILVVLPVKEEHKERIQNAAPDAKTTYCLEAEVTKEQVQDGFVHIRLLGDGNLIYDNTDLNAGNCQMSFDIDVSGVSKLSLEYNGICDITDVLFGMSDAKLYS